MGKRQFDEKPAKEMDHTAGAAADDRFEAILKRVKEAGAEFLKDEISPLYIDVGRDEVEIGEQRVVQFNLNKTDFEITRKVEKVKIVGDGHHKSFEDLSRPRIEIKLKSKSEMSDQWVIMDMDDMF